MKYFTKKCIQLQRLFQQPINKKKEFDNFLITCLVFFSPLKVAPSADYASLAFFSSYDEEAILKVNAKIDGDVMISFFFFLTLKTFSTTH